MAGGGVSRREVMLARERTVAKYGRGGRIRGNVGGEGG